MVEPVRVEGKSGDNRAAADPGGSLSEPVPADQVSRWRRLWKWLTGSPLRRLLSALGAILVAAISALITTAVSGLFSGHISVTQTFVFTPWTATGHLSSAVQISVRLSGYCVPGGSNNSPRPDAHRCFTLRGKQGIYDPCFAPEFLPSTQVVCPFPNTVDVTLIDLTKRLPATPLPPTVTTPSIRFAWQLVLSGGELCYRDNSAFSGSAAGIPLTYFCKDGNDYLYGNPQRSSTGWEILEQIKGAPNITLAPIAKAYS